MVFNFGKSVASIQIDMKFNLRTKLRKFYLQLNVVERLVVIIIGICFLFPLTLPNCYSFGYIQVPEPKSDCKSLNYSVSEGICELFIFVVVLIKFYLFR